MLGMKPYHESMFQWKRKVTRIMLHWPHVHRTSRPVRPHISKCHTMRSGISRQAKKFWHQ